MSPIPPHTAKSVLLSCIDARLVASDAEFIDEIGGAFHARLAGGGLSLVNPTDREVALKQIVAAYTINQIEQVYLESHTDCGAYRLVGVTFESPESEIERLYDDLDEAAEFVKDGLATAGAHISAIKIDVRVVNPNGTLEPRKA